MIVVFGSINIDLVARVARIAAPGETVLAPSYAAFPGGKGANQALAARRAGAQVRLVGAVGRDSFADAALALLRADSVDLSAVAQVDAPTGTAFIAVDAQGQNAITVASGANAHAKASQIGRMRTGDILLLQREVPDAQGEVAARMAKAANARVILNLAPYGRVSQDYLGLVDVLVMNEHEAAALAIDLGMAGATPAALAQKLEHDLALSTIVTLGAAGALGQTGGQRMDFAAAKVDVVDSTGAGDAFVGALAAALAAGSDFHAWPNGDFRDDFSEDFHDAVVFAIAAGSLACTKAGAQPSLPWAGAIQKLAINKTAF